jgi:serralysin
MPVLSFVTYLNPANSALMSHITDLAILDDPGGPVLYSTTRFDGQITAWDIDGAGISAISTVTYRQVDVPGSTPQLGLIKTESGSALLYGGGSSAAMNIVSLNSSGSFGTQSSLGVLPGISGNLTHTVSVQLADGSSAIYGGVAGGSGVAVVRLSAAGSLQSSTVTNSSAAAHAGTISAMETAQIGGVNYVFSADSDDPGVTAWQVGSTGALTAVANLGNQDGLWVSKPTALASATVDGVSYLVVAAAGSSSLSVVRVGANGTMVVTDHVLDDLNTRFANASALGMFEVGGRSYLVAGGSDDGISLFQLLPGGTLLAMGHMADTVTSGLANVSALAAIGNDSSADIYVSSALETGLTRLDFNPGPLGTLQTATAQGSILTGNGANDLLVGGAGADRLSGAAGDDILMDGAGVDTLTGGAGADTFVISADGGLDTITDFTIGIDRIELSSWGMLRSLNQLTMQATATGLTITFGNEVLIVNTSSGGTLNPLLLQNSDLLNLSRLATALPNLPDVDDPFNGDDGDDTLTGTANADTLTGFGGADLLTGEAGNDVLYGGAGDDRLYGGIGADRLEGGEGRDLLEGGDGVDWLEGGLGADTLWGYGGNDQLYGGGDADLLDGGAGSDTLSGGLGNDRYIIDSAGDVITGEVGYSLGGGIDTVESWVDFQLGNNIEILRLQGSGNLNGTGSWAPEAMVGNAGHNRLDGSRGFDQINGKSGDDTLIGGQGLDWLVGEAGADHFVYREAADSGIGQANRDLINGFEHGVDVIDLSALDANLLQGGDQAFRFIGTAGFTGTGVAEVRAWTWGTTFNLIEIDIGGDGNADMQIFVNQTNFMLESDFIL